MKLLISFSLITTSMLFANPFENSDELFKRRADGIEASNRAIASYKDLIGKTNLNSDQQNYGHSQIARLHVYKGYITTDLTVVAQYANDCIADIDSIKTLNSPHYHYWWSVCMMLRASTRGSLGGVETLMESSSVEAAAKAGLALDASYEGGGFDRVLGIIYFKMPMFNPFGPSQDFDKSFEHFEKSIDSGAYIEPVPVTWKNVGEDEGWGMYQTFYYYAAAQKDFGDTDASLEIIEEALEGIEEGDVLEGYEPETEVAKQRLLTLKSNL